MNISVVITTFNRKYEVRRAIETVYAQTVMPYEIIVVDDASQDGTKEYLESFDFKEIRYFWLDQNIGASAARNYGVSKARGEYIAFLDSDNEWYPETIEYFQNLLEEMRESYNIISSHYIEREKFYDVEYPPKNVGNYAEEVLKYNIAEASASLYRKSFLKAVNGFSTDFQIYADWELLLRCMEYGGMNFYLGGKVLSKNWTMYNSLSENKEFRNNEKERLKINYPKLEIYEEKR